MSMDKARAIETAVSQIERAFGKGAIMRLGGDQVLEVETVSTGSLGLEKSGAWFSYDSQRLGQGRENAKVFLKDNPELATEIESKIRQNAGFLIADLKGNDDMSGSENAA